MDEKNKEATNLFLAKAKLNGFLTIKFVEVGFQPGLNIIIGKNGAGKTNFMNFLNKLINFDYRNLIQFKSLLEFHNGQKIKIEANHEISLNDIIPSNEVITNQIISPKISINEVEIDSKNDVPGGGINRIRREQRLASSSLVKHGIPYNNFFIVDSPLKYTIDDHGIPDFFEYISDDTPYFIKTILVSLFLPRSNRKQLNEDTLGLQITESVNNHLRHIKTPTKKYSPIEDIRLSPNFNIFNDKDKKSITVNNIFLEFKINNSWLPFSSLSDGTKRIFYIITEVATPSLFFFLSGGFGVTGSLQSRIILIEEPELGLHPHQLHKLMEFLYTQSKQKQIILTTHSPDVLDILKKDELNRIIISYFSPEKQTQLRHLNDNEIIKAKKYIEKDFLSDYWKYSDLE